MEIDEVVFPARLAFGLSGGPERQVDIVALASGMEHRNARQSRSRRRYRLPANRRPLAEMRELLDFYEARGGALRGFLFDDPVANATLAGVEIGVGDGTQTDFQLALESGRIITRPKPGTVTIAVNGIELDGAAFSVDGTTGLVTLAVAPAGGEAVTANFGFHVPVRFENAALTVTNTSKDAGEHDEIHLVEILP